MQDVIEVLLKYGYLVLFFYSLGGGMVGILAAGILSYEAKLDLTLCIVVAFLGNALGSSMLFLMTKYYKKDILLYFKKHRRKLALASLKIKQYGLLLLFTQKFIYGLKTFIPMAAALVKYNIWSFLLINFCASLLWSVSLAFLAYSFSAFIQNLFVSLSKYPYLALVFLAFLALVIWLYLSKFSKK